jgi:predicted RNA-binding protein YlxR (DUF448 family)
VELALTERETDRRGEAGRPARAARSPRVPTRTCVGCGERDDASALVRLVVADDEVAFDLAGGAFGRGAHLHARPSCLEKAPRGLARAFRRPMKQDAAALGRLLVDACNRRIAGLLLAAFRSRALAVGADASIEALGEGAPLGVLALDAGSLVSRTEIERCVAAGRAVAWGTKSELGSLFGAPSVAICAVRHAGIAAELKRMRVTADAGSASTREGAECSRCPEAR